MSITDELRGFANSGMSAMECSAYSDKLIAIADRIDAAVEGMVELPKDADNVPWNVGDRDEDGNVVTQLRLSSDGWYAITDGLSAFHPEQRRHHHAPTVDDVLREFALAVCKDEALTIRKGVVEEYAKRLTLAEGED